MTGIAFGHRSTSNNACALGHLLWHDDGKGDGPVLCFLMGKFNSESRSEAYWAGFIEQGISGPVRPQHCQPAGWECAEKLDLTGIVCYSPRWGVGMIVEQPNFGTHRWNELVVALPEKVSDGRSPNIRTTLPEVELRFFGSRPQK